MRYLCNTPKVFSPPVRVLKYHMGSCR
uniref:Uncharacterized protein n=1 Tax=Anguilla anguilla TaxID=7936 RepID=A0A0E9TXC1_ANGAN